jgi:hypothetical protein
MIAALALLAVTASAINVVRINLRMISSAGG